jgi:hypothetical protein
VFRGRGASWGPVYTIGGTLGELDGRLKQPYGLRFSEDGSTVMVADYGNSRVSTFGVAGAFLRHVACGLPCPRDMEAVHTKSAWLIACSFPAPYGLVSAHHATKEPRTTFRVLTCNDERLPAKLSLAYLPEVGLITRDHVGFQFFTHLDAVALASMSACRVAWMTTVHRFSWFMVFPFR